MEIEKLQEVMKTISRWKNIRIITTEGVLNECLREDNSCNRTRARNAMKELYEDLKEYANLLMALSLTGTDPSTKLEDIKAGKNTMDIDNLMWGDSDE